MSTFWLIFRENNLQLTGFPTLDKDNMSIVTKQVIPYHNKEVLINCKMEMAS